MLLTLPGSDLVATSVQGLVKDADLECCNSCTCAVSLHSKLVHMVSSFYQYACLAAWHTLKTHRAVLYVGYRVKGSMSGSSIPHLEPVLFSLRKGS